MGEDLTRCSVQKGALIQNTPNSPMESLIPVSYTHLDVYKRQEICVNPSKIYRRLLKNEVRYAKEAGEIFMENDIWNEISSFLNQLRCENINRESYIYFQELANIQLKKKMEKEKVNKLLDLSLIHI